MSGYVMVRRRSTRRVDQPIAARPLTTTMTRTDLTVRNDLSLGDALAVMVRHGIRHVLVVDLAGRCVGVLADRVVASSFARDPSALTWQRVGEVLDPTPAFVGTGATVADAARVMCATGVDAVAVVDADNRPMGVVTSGDLIALLAR